MNTLQKVAESEARINVLEKKLAVFEVLATGMPQVTQEVGRLNGDIATLSQSIKNIVDGINKKTKDLSEMDNMVITRLMGLEQSYASLSKTLAAIVSELSDSKVLNQESVMVRLRKSDEAADRDRTAQMVQLKVIQEVEEVVPDSLVAISQTFTDKEGKVDVVTDYRTMEIGSPMIDEETRKNYVGKRASDVVELNLEDGVLKTTILQVFSYVQKFAESQGENLTKADKEEQPEA